MIADVRRLLAGSVVSPSNASPFACVGLAGLFVDLLIFETLYSTGFGLVTAHVCSFAAAALFNYFLNSRWTFAAALAASPEQAWQRHSRFLVICMLALAIRGGVLACAVELLKWPPQVGIFLAVGVAAIVNNIGSAFFVFSSLSPPLPPDMRWRIAAVGVLAYVSVLRLTYIGLVDLLPEEAYYWNYARHLSFGYLDHPPMIAWLVWAGTSIFGDTEFGVRIGAFIAWFAIALFGFGLTRNLFGRSAAFVSIILISTLPFFFFYGGLAMMPDAPLTVAWSGALYFLERALLAERRWAWLGVGICIGLGMISKYTIALLGPATLVFILCDPRSRRWLIRPEPYLAVAIAAMLFTPVVLWNAQHDWASFAFQGSRRVQGSFRFSFHELVGSAMILLTPFGLFACIRVLLRRVQIFKEAVNFSDSARASLFTLAYTLAPLTVFVAFSVFHAVKLSWTGPIWLALLPALSASIVAVGDDWRHDGVVRKLWFPTIAATLVIYGIGLHFLALNAPVGISLNLRTLPVAWQEFGREVGLIAHDVEKKEGAYPLLIGMDTHFLTSEIAFYNRESSEAFKNTVGRGALARNSLMFDFWHDPKDAYGKNAILFAVTPADLLGKDLTQRFDRMGEVEERKVFKAGKLASWFYYRVGYNLKHPGT